MVKRMARETVSALLDPLMKATESNLGSVILWKGGTVSRIRTQCYIGDDEQDVVTLSKSVVIKQDDAQPTSVADGYHDRGIWVDDDVGQLLRHLSPHLVQTLPIVLL